MKGATCAVDDGRIVERGILAPLPIVLRQINEIQFSSATKWSKEEGERDREREGGEPEKEGEILNFAISVKEKVHLRILLFRSVFSLSLSFLPSLGLRSRAAASKLKLSGSRSRSNSNNNNKSV